MPKSPRTSLFALFLGTLGVLLCADATADPGLVPPKVVDDEIRDDERLEPAMDDDDDVHTAADGAEEDHGASKFALPHVEMLVASARAEAEAHATTVAVGPSKDPLRTIDRQVRRGLEQLADFAGRLEFDDKAALKRSGSFFEMTPYVRADAWRKAVELLAENKCDDALASANTVVDPHAREADHPLYEPAVDYAMARMESCSARSSVRAAGRSGLVRVAGQTGAAAHLAKRLLRRASSPYATEGRAERLGQMMSRVRHLGKTKGLRAALDELDVVQTAIDPRREPWTKARMDLVRAELLEKAGKHDDAAALYLDLYARTSRWKVHSTVREGIVRLERKTKRQVLPFSARVDRMRSMIAAGDYKGARKLSIANAKLRKAGRKEQQGWKHYRLGLIAERDKERGKAIGHFEKADELIRDAAVRPRLYMGWARALRRLDRDAEAIALYEKLCTEFPRDELCGEGLYHAGRLRQYGGKLPQAVDTFARLIGEHPENRHAADALWRGGFALHLAGEYDRARAAFAELAERFGELEDRSDLPLGLKAKYWQAMSSLRAGEEALAAKQFEATIEAGPLTWYGRLAMARLVEMGKLERGRELAGLGLDSVRLRPADLDTLEDVFVPKSTRLEAAVVLARLGLYEEALVEAAAQTEYYPRPAGARRLAATLHVLVGRPDRGHWMARKELDFARLDASELRQWGTAYPLDYAELAHRHGTEAGVDPFLVQAIIRQESGFRPEVQSWAGAVGLMQLMPRTASNTAKRFGESKRVRIRDLKKPETNVQLGARYVRLHTAHAKDHVPLALAGYNAGPRSLENWIERFGGLELDAWVESITFQEARGYVRKVMTSYITYSALYGGVLPSVSLTLPQKLAEWGDFRPKVSMIPGSAAVAVR